MKKGKTIRIKISNSKERFNVDIETAKNVTALQDKLKEGYIDDFGQKDWTNQPDYFKAVLSNIVSFSREDLYIELGVFTGATLRYIRQNIPEQFTIYGFDAFNQGLPEDWGVEGYLLKEKRFFRLEESFGPSQIEQAIPNIVLIDGLVQDTLARFLKDQNKKIKFIHLDLDLYSATRYSLEAIAEYLDDGTVIVFDDFTNYPGWEQHSFKSLADTIEKITDRFDMVPIASMGMEEDAPECRGWSSFAFLLRKKEDSVEKTEKFVSSNMDNKQGQEKNITVVTGLWDLGRGNLDSWAQRDFQQYKDRFFEFLKTPIPMCIWIPSDLEQEVREERGDLPTRIFIKEVSDFETWNPFYEKIQEIRAREDWRYSAFWLYDSPQAALSHYNAMMFTKVFMVNDSAVMNPFGSKYFFWVDGGLTSTVDKGYFTKDLVLDNLSNYVKWKNDKVVHLTYPYLTNDEIHGFSREGMNKYCGVEYVGYVARGGFFGGKAEAIHRYNALYYEYMRESLEEGLMGADESLFTIMCHRHPDLIDRFDVGEDGLVWPFFEELKNHKSRRHLAVLYVLTYNSPKQFEYLCESFQQYDPRFLTQTEKYLLNNSTNREMDEEYKVLCERFGFVEIKKDNIGICGGRQFIAEHFNRETQGEYYFFFEDDMNFYTGKSAVCRNGFSRKIPNLFSKVLTIAQKERFDFLKLNFSEFFGDNSRQWAWHNVPQDVREELFPEHPTLTPPVPPYVKYSSIRTYEDLPYCTGEIFYCNWPQIVSREGNRKMFLEQSWEHPYEQTWMSYIYQKTIEGEIKPGLLLATPTEHHRFDFYPKEERREN